MLNDNIWHLWFLDVLIDSETMLSMSVLAHIYDNDKKGLVHSSDRQARSVCLDAHNTPIQFKPQLEDQL
jgi:hypothetical protein